MTTEQRIRLDSINRSSSLAVRMGQTLSIPWPGGKLQDVVKNIGPSDLDTDTTARIIPLIHEMRAAAEQFFAENEAARINRGISGRPDKRNDQLMAGWLHDLQTALGRA